MLRILHIPKWRTKGHELSRGAKQLRDSRMLAFASDENVFTFGNLPSFVAIDWLIEIKAETILYVPPSLEHCNRTKLRWNVLLLDIFDEGGNLPA